MQLRPMNAFSGTSKILSDHRYVFEPKLDGYRAFCFVDGKKMKFISRNGNDLTTNYPEFTFRDHISSKSCILDGEIVVFDKNGNPDFQLLQQGFKEASFVVFDILKKNGKDLTELPLSERKKILDETVTNNEGIEKSVYTEDGKALYNLMAKRHLEGVMAKELNSRYYPNKRSKVWLKIKLHKSVDAIIIGYTQSKRTVSSLALALYDNKNHLRYIGKVGTGFSADVLAEIEEKINKIENNQA